jgi:NAD(P)-dependent dehydrogenase (short-subunit alcohol dehydrogenase family)
LRKKRHFFANFFGENILKILTSVKQRRFFSVWFVKCNVAEADDWTNLWDEAERVLGGNIDLLLNNAGINPTVQFIVLLILDHCYCFC